MDARNIHFLFYGLFAAWLIVMAYVVSLGRRNARLRRELRDVKNLANVDGAGSHLSSR